MTLPVWGTPWHGRVSGGVLQLPNGSTRSYTQPLAKSDVISGVSTPIPDTWGNTYRQFVPGTPAVERTPAEQAIDTAAGYQWRNAATLSGARFQLYGKQLDGWIYVDPAGDRWLVRCTQLDENQQYSTTSALALTVTLRRFGDFGAPLEVYSYATSITDWGLNAGYELNPARLLVDDIRADGARAALMVHARSFNTGSRQDVRRAQAWLELSIAGLGSAATVGVSVLRSQADVFQVTRDTIPQTPSLVGWYQSLAVHGAFDWVWVVLPGAFGDGDNPPSAEYTKDPGLPTQEKWRVRQVEPFTGEVSFEFRRIAAVWYDTFGAAVDLHQVFSFDAVVDWPMPPEDTRLCTTEIAWRVGWDLAGVELGGVLGRRDGTSTQQLTPSTQSYLAELVDTTDGAVKLSSGTDPRITTRWVNLDLAMITLLTRPYEILLSDLATTGTLAYFDVVQVVRYANHVVGLRAERATDVGFTLAFHPPATPSGIAPGVPYVPPTNTYTTRYGSWCPYSGAVVWGATAPVCYV